MIIRPQFLLLFSLLLPVTNASAVDFATEVWPIIERRCIECHGPEKQNEGLRFDDLFWLKDDELLGAGDSAKSLIFQAISLPEGEDGFMPKKRESLTPEEIGLIQQWLTDGADSTGWVVPENIVVVKTGFKSSDNRLAVLAEDVPPAPEDALVALRDIGAVAVPMALSNNLVRVDFGLSRNPVTDAQLALLSPLSDHLTVLGLSGTAVTDDGLAQLRPLEKLTQIRLGETQLSDAGMSHLAALPNLEIVNIIRTQVTDAGLAMLSELEHLRKVFAWESKITPDAARAFMAAHPEVTVDLGMDLSVPEESQTAPIDLSSMFDAGSCCAVAHEEGGVCDHACCIEAAAKNEVCLKCNPGATL